MALYRIDPIPTVLSQVTAACPVFLKVYGLNGPEARGHALKCLRLDIQARRTYLAIPTAGS